MVDRRVGDVEEPHAPDVPVRDDRRVEADPIGSAVRTIGIQLPATDRDSARVLDVDRPGRVLVDHPGAGVDPGAVGIGAAAVQSYVCGVPLNEDARTYRRD